MAFSCVVLVTSGGFLSGGEVMSVKDQKGRAIEIELVSVADKSVTFLRQGKEFTMPISQFDAASQELITKEAASLPVVIPKIMADVVIGKRRRDKAGSYYMVKQEVSCTVKLTNSSKTLVVPPIKGKIIFIGQNSKTPDLLTVLSTQDFEAAMTTGETVIREMKPFVTSYDSDNKGVGNIGGYQYYGYVLALMDADGKVLLSQTTTGSFRNALDAKSGLLKQVIEYSSDTSLTSKLELSK